MERVVYEVNTLLCGMVRRHTSNDDFDAELRSSDNWDWDSGVTDAPSPDPGLIVGIRLNRDNARVLGDAARRANMPISRFILAAALEAADRDASRREAS
jgi:hypothetical protein